MKPSQWHDYCHGIQRSVVAPPSPEQLIHMDRIRALAFKHAPVEDIVCEQTAEGEDPLQQYAQEWGLHTIPVEVKCFSLFSVRSRYDA